MRMIDKVVSKMEMSSVFYDIVLELGKRHATYEVTEDHFKVQYSIG